MKGKHLMAAALGCVTLLAGCGNESGENERSSGYSGSSSSSSSVVSEVESSEQSTSTTETTQSSSSLASFSEPEEKENEIPTPYIYRIYYDAIIQLEWRTNDSDFMVDESYNMRVFWSSSNGQEKSMDVYAWKPIMFTKDHLFSGDNYFRIQLYNSKGESEISEPFCYSLTGTSDNANSIAPATPDVHQYTHTFDTPAGISVVPDYTKSLNEIQDGVQPYSFYVRIYYTCPLCGHKKEVDSANFYYSFDSSYTVPFVRCGKASCPNAKSSKKVTINYYATQIS